MRYYIYPNPIVPYAPAFLHSFLLLVTVVQGIGPKQHTYFYSVVLEFSGVILYLSDNTICTSIFTQLTIISDCCKGYSCRYGIEHFDHSLDTIYYILQFTIFKTYSSTDSLHDVMITEV